MFREVRLALAVFATVLLSTTEFGLVVLLTINSQH
jgi:hypothetical protein